MEPRTTMNPEEIRAELERVLASAPFANSNRGQKFLRHVVEGTLNDSEDALKEYSIAIDVFGRDASYDPSIDATVRVEAGRLRSRLLEYYAGDGKNDSVVIEMPKGGYRVTFREGSPPSDAQSLISQAPEILAPAGKRNRRTWTVAVLALVAVVFTAAIGIFLRWRAHTHFPAADANGARVLAVLPFPNHSGNTAESSVMDGMTENLIRAFSELPQIRVISRAAIDEVGAKNAAGTLGAGYLLNGELQRNAQGGLLLSTELSDARSGLVLSSYQYVLDQEDLRSVQADIVKDVIKRLGIGVDANQATNAEKAPTSSPAAFEAFLRGEASGRQHDNPASLHDAIHEFEEAIRLDPSFALAYSSLAECQLELGVYFEAPKDHMPLARAFAEKALSLDPSLHQAHGILGLIDLLYDWNFPAAQTELAAADSRNDAIWKLGCTVHLLATSGKYRHAEEDINRMLEFDPKSAMLVSELGCVNYYAGHLDDSIRYYRQALADDPHSVLANWGIGRALGLQGHYKEALEILRNYRTISGMEPPIITAEIGYIDAVSGDKNGAESTLKQLAAESKHIYVDKFLIATIYLGLNDRTRAYTLLDDSYAEHSPFLVSLATDPKWAGWRDDAHFRALWSKMTSSTERQTAALDSSVAPR